MLGTFVWVGRNTFNVVISHMADKPTREANTRGIWRVNVLYPQPVLLLMTVLPRRARPPTSGPSSSRARSISSAPACSASSPSSAAWLPAVGIALNLKVIMKKSVAPYFFMGFFLVSYLGMTMMGVAAFAIAAAALYLFNDMQKAEVA